MRRYNKDKRATRKAHIQAQGVTHEAHEAQDIFAHIHIDERYDGYKQTIYIAEFERTRDTHAKRYVEMTNIINEILPEINAPHTDKTYLATSPYTIRTLYGEHKYTEPHAYGDDTKPIIQMKRAKCIIYNRQGEFIHADTFIRRIKLYRDELEITLHRGQRQIHVYPYAPTDGLHGYSIQELRRRGVEFYMI